MQQKISYVTNIYRIVWVRTLKDSWDSPGEIRIRFQWPKTYPTRFLDTISELSIIYSEFKIYK